MRGAIFALLTSIAALPGYGQESEPGQPPAAPDTSQVMLEPTREVVETADRILKQVETAIQDSDRLTDRRKARMLRVLNRRPKVAQRVVDEVTARALDADLITFDYYQTRSDDDDEEGKVRARVDWDSIIAFIERLIPLIVQLIGLFGG